MLEKLKLVEARYLEMAERAAQPDFYNDAKAAAQLLKEQRQLEPIITAYRSYNKTLAEQDDLRAMLSEGLEPEMKALCQEEFAQNKKTLEALEQELKILLLPRDPNDDKSVIMEIRGGVGGFAGADAARLPPASDRDGDAGGGNVLRVRLYFRHLHRHPGHHPLQHGRVRAARAGRQPLAGVVPCHCVAHQHRARSSDGVRA